MPPSGDRGLRCGFRTVRRQETWAAGQKLIRFGRISRGARFFWPNSRCVCPDHLIESGVRGLLIRVSKGVHVTLTCPNCGNDRNFQVKTLQMHVVHLEDGRVEVSDESRPAVLEVLCDERESALHFEELEDTLRKEVLHTIGAR